MSWKYLKGTMPYERVTKYGNVRIGYGSSARSYKIGGCRSSRRNIW